MRLRASRCSDCASLDAYTAARARWAESILGRPSRGDPIREVVEHLIERALTAGQQFLEIRRDGLGAVTIGESSVSVPPEFQRELFAFLGLAARWANVLQAARVERVGRARFRLSSV
jgi:hypothetical protein